MYTPGHLARAWLAGPFRAFLCALLLTSLDVGAVRAQTVFDQNGFGTGRGTYSALPYEHVDPLSGNLIVVSTDLVLPGNGGLDLVVQRIYNSAVYPQYANNGNKTLGEDSWAGVGWRLHFGRVLFEANNGSGETQIEMGDGSAHELYTTSAHPEGWITKDFWLYDKNTHKLKLPNGRTYSFDHQVFIANYGVVRYVTEIRDQFNNTITFDYFPAGGPPDGVREIRQDLGQNEVRTVTFTVDPNLKSLASMTFGTSVWTYGQTQFPSAPAGYTRLNTVQPPAGAKPWTYGYEGTSGFVALSSMQAPSGGIVSYTYGDATRTAGATAPYYTQLSRVVTTRSIGGPPETKITPGTWTFSYNQGANQDESIVDCSCGKTVYRYLGVGTDASGGFEAWRTGLLAERKLFGAGNQLLEREVLTWTRSEAISPDAVPGVNGLWTDPDVYNPLMASRVLHRGTRNWTTTYAYRTGLGNYNDFGQPFETTETGGYKTRTTSYTFWYGVPFLSGRLASATVTVGSQTSTMSATYDPGTGALASQTVNGATTSYGSYANGNLRRVWDAHNHETHYAAYSYGVATEIQTPLLTTYRLVSNAGLVTREQVGTLFTDYAYDLAFRPTRVSPPNANPIFYWYDGQWDGWQRVERGSAETHTVVDGFGRPVSSVNQVSQRTLIKRDACGRVTFQALPYTNPIFAERGIETTYDALGRVTKTRFVDGSAGGGPEAAETTYAYDGLDVTITDPLGQITKQEYSAIGGPGDAVLTAVVDAAGQRTTYSYDIGSRLTQVGGAMPARSWTYNTRGLLTSETHPESGTSSYTYDVAGLLKTTTDSTGTIFTLNYDANDRLTSRDGPGTVSDMTLTYDTLGRLSTQQNAAVTTTHQYDTAGRLSLRRDVFLGQTYESLYGYDNNDNLTSLTYPSGRVIGYGYDAENRLTSVTQNGAPFASTFLYDDGGALASYVTGAVTHRSEFDIRQRVSRITAGPGVATPLDMTYTYNKGNQIKFIADPRFGAPQAFQYDVLNRMTRAQGPWGDLQWSYDAAGNRLTEQQGGPTTFTYDANQRLTSFLTATGGESFAYDALGRLTSDSRGTYTYTPGSRLATVTGANVAASYAYDAADARIQRTVNGIAYYSIRGASGQVLSEYEARCGGAAAWTRDTIYAGSLSLGAVRAPSNQPTIALTTASSSVGESAGTTTVTVQLTTPNGAATTCAASVSYRVATHAGEAARGSDFSGAVSTLSFPAGTASGATQTITVTIKPDTILEGNERLSVDLTGATGADLGVASQIVTIVDDDAPPSITIDDVQVTEGPGAQAVFTLTLSPVSALQAEVNYITSPESARTNIDYSTTAGRVIFLPGETQKQVAVPILDNAFAEPAETFQLQLSAPLQATLARTFGRATIVDDEGPRVPIDPTYPGTYFPDVTTAPDAAAYIPIFNPHAVAVTARLTFTRPNGTGVVRDFVVPALMRMTVDVANEPQIGGLGDVSAVVQSLDVARPLVAESTGYWQTDWRGGRNTRGRTGPAPTWYFAEGATSTFDEYLTVFNPSNEPINVVMTLLPSALLATQQYTIPIESGPGRVKIRVNDYVPSMEHGTIIAGLTLAGAPTNIVVERSMYWQGGDRRDGHSANGASTAGHRYYFAEGAIGPFAVFIPLANPNTTSSNVTVYYLYGNGVEFQQSDTIPALGRITLSPPPSLPPGPFSFYVETTNGVGFVADRVIYGGAGWTYGDAETGTQTTSTRWKFAEGAASSFFSSYLLLGNPTASPANVTLTFRTDTGGTVTHTVTVSARGRASVDLNGVPGLAGTIFATEVDVTNGVAIVAERAMFWPASWNGAHVSIGRPW